MAAAVGCPAESFLYTSVEEQDLVAEAGQTLGLETILAILQIIDHTLARMRYSTQGRTLAETALVRICYLENLDALSSLLSQLQDGSELASPPGASSPQAAANRPRTGAPAARQDSPQASADSDPSNSKKKAELNVPAENVLTENGPAEIRPRDPLGLASSPPANGVSAATTSVPIPAGGGGPADRAERPLVRFDAGLIEQSSSSDTDSPTASESPRTITSENASAVWQRALASLSGGILAGSAAYAERIATSAPNRLVVSFPERYNFHKSVCERPEQLSQLQRAVSEAAGGHVQIEFALFACDKGSNGPVVQQPVKTSATGRQWLAEKSNEPFVRQVAEIFGATPFRADPPAE